MKKENSLKKENIPELEVNLFPPKNMKAVRNREKMIHKLLRESERKSFPGDQSRKNMRTTKWPCENKYEHFSRHPIK